VKITSTLKELEALYPDIAWRKPIDIVWPDGRLYSCRVCIANNGLTRGSQWQWFSYADAGRHIVLEHERKSSQ